MIVDGKIKLKSNSGGIKNFTKDSLIAEDGSELRADVVVFATGYGDPRNPIRKIVGEEVGNKITPIWGIDEEGELRSAWKELGVPNLWLMMGKCYATRCEQCLTKSCRKPCVVPLLLKASSSS